MRSVERLDPQSGQQLPSVTLPSNIQTFVDAKQVGDTTYLAWTTKRGFLWLASADRGGRIAGRWRVGSAAGFERPSLERIGKDGTGILEVTADGRNVLLVNGVGLFRFATFIDLGSGIVRSHLLPDGLDRNVADVAVLDRRFVLVGFAGNIITMGPHGEILAQAKLMLHYPISRFNYADASPVSRDQAVVSFTNRNKIYERMRHVDNRRIIARYDAITGTLAVERRIADDQGDGSFLATPTSFAVFGDYKWLTGRFGTTPVQTTDPPPGADPDAPPVIHNPTYLIVASAFGAAPLVNGRITVLRYIFYDSEKNINPYLAFEVVEVDIEQNLVIRRIRFGDLSGRAGPLPYAFDIRL